MSIFKSDDTTFEMYDPETGDTVLTVDRSTLTVDVNKNRLENIGSLSLDGDLESATTGTIWDESAGEIPDSALGTVSSSTLGDHASTHAKNGGDSFSGKTINPASTETGTLDFDTPVENQTTTSVGSSHTIDLSTGTVKKFTLTADTTFDFTNVASSGVNSVTLILVQDSTGGRTPSFTPTVLYAGGSAPPWSTSSGAIDVLTLVRDADSGNWLGFLGGSGFA